MRKKNVALRAGCHMLLLLGASGVFADVLQDRVNKLEQELAELKAAMAKNDAQPAVKSTGIEIKKGTSFNYGGFIKVDAMFSDYDSGERPASGIGDDIYVPSLVPVGGDDGDTRFDSHVKTSRFWLKTATQTGVGVIRTHIETDYWTQEGNERISNSSGSRLRHGYLAWDYAPGASLLAGQTWSTFFNVGALPEAVDFIGPTAGTIFIRQTQLRWTQPLGEGSLMLALENPSASLYDGGAGFSNNNYDDNSLPDLIARYNHKTGDFSFSTAVMAREIAYQDSPSGRDDDAMGYGISVSGKWMLGKDDLKFMVSQGNLGRYIALNTFRDGAVEADGSIDLVDQLGGFIAYRHWWSDQWRSTLSYAMTEADLPDAVAATSTEIVSNSSLNLIYSPTKNLSFGGEYIHAVRELESGDEGKMGRLQFMAKWVF